MTIVFSDEEKEYLIFNKFNWSIKDNCPDSIKKQLKIKLKLLSEYKL